MQNRMSLRISQSILRVEKETPLQAAQKAVLRWADIDDHQAILDADCSDEGLLTYVNSHNRIQAYGLLVKPKQQLSVKGDAIYSELLYASRTDLPWRDNKFDTVLVTKPQRKDKEAELFMKEIQRVLKPGGRVLIAVMQSVISRFFTSVLFRKTSKYLMDSSHEMMDLLEKQGYVDSSARQSSFDYVCVIAKKPENESDLHA